MTYQDSAKENSLLAVGLGWFPITPGGLNRYLFELYSQLDFNGDRSVICGVDFPQKSQKKQIFLKNLASSEESVLKRLWSIKKSFDEVLNIPLEAINLHFALYSLPVLHQLPKELAVTFTFHGPWCAEVRQEVFPWHPKLLFQAAIEKYVYHRCDRFITLSQAFADILHQDYDIPAEKIHIIPGGINTKKFQANLTRQQARKQLGFPVDRPILFCPRRLVQRMGIDKLLQALVTVQQQVPNVWLAIAGKGPQRNDLEQQAQQLGLMNHVKFLGYVPEEELPICYQAADLTVVPSQALEGFGLILLESLASGTPVVSTPVGGMPEVLRPFSPDLVTADTSAEAIGDRILQFLTGRLSLPSREACRAYAVKNYDWQIIAPRVKDVLLMPKK